MSEAAITNVARRPSEGGGRWLRDALPAWREALVGGLVWAGVTAACAVFGLLGEGWRSADHIRDVAVLYFFGGLVAFPLALWAARLFPRRRAAEADFAVFFLTLAVATIAVTASLFGLQYRLYYAEWHAEPLSKIWLIQFVHTVAGAVFQFAVLGIRLYFPLGFAALFVAALWFQRLTR